MSNIGWTLMLLVPGLLILGVPLTLDYLRKRRLARAMDSLAEVLGKRMDP